MVVRAKIYLYQRHFDGFPKEGDLKLVEQNLPPLQNGEFLAEAVYLSVDPYMRAHAEELTLGTTFPGGQVAKIIESKNPKYPVGAYVVGMLGWRSHTICGGTIETEGIGKGMAVRLAPKNLGGLPHSVLLGAAGMTGNTAYFGFLELCRPKEGDTVVVTGAGGAVGSQVGQIAKIKGCKVIGIAGSNEKGDWLLKELGFDYFINYKTDNIDEKLKEYAPKGVDCYFDNVGGEISTTVMNHMNQYGRVSVCGAISSYNDDVRAKSVYPSVIGMELVLEGFLVPRWADRWSEGVQQNIEWLREGKIKYKETVTHGIENMFKAFTEMLKGQNTGKAVVKY